MPSKRDYYEILEIERSATQEEIKKAFRRLAVKHHPDKNQGNGDSEEKFKEINEAYEILSNEEKKSVYDQFGHEGIGAQGGAGFGFGGGGFGGFGDIFNDFFGDIFSSQQNRKSRAQRGSDLRYGIKIKFEEAIFGISKEIKFNRYETCDSCEGSGAKKGTSPVTCPVCKGTGEIRQQQGFFMISRPCYKCKGTGEFIEHACNECHGEGRSVKERKLDIKIPPGVNDGNRLKVSGEGSSGLYGGPPGDLYVDVTVKTHEIFKREENNIFVSIPISFSQAALGTEIDAPTVDGKSSLKIPPGTQSGTRFTIKGKGAPSLNGRGRGNEYVSVLVETPTNLSSKQKKILEDLAKESGEETHPFKKSFFDKIEKIFSLKN